MSMQLLTARQVGQQLGIPETKVRAEARAGRFPHHKVGRYSLLGGAGTRLPRPHPDRIRFGARSASPLMARDTLQTAVHELVVREA